MTILSWLVDPQSLYGCNTTGRIDRRAWTCMFVPTEHQHTHTHTTGGVNLALTFSSAELRRDQLRDCFYAAAWNSRSLYGRKSWSVFAAAVFLNMRFKQPTTHPRISTSCPVSVSTVVASCEKKTAWPWKDEKVKSFEFMIRTCFSPDQFPKMNFLYKLSNMKRDVLESSIHLSLSIRVSMATKHHYDYHSIVEVCVCDTLQNGIFFFFYFLPFIFGLSALCVVFSVTRNRFYSSLKPFFI